MKSLVLAAAAALVLSAGTVSAQEVGASVGSLEGRDTAISLRYQPDVLAGPLGTDVEFTYDAPVGDNTYDASNLGANLVRDFELTDRLSVYALGGLGYSWNDIEDSATWQYGAGATFDLTSELQLDARVRQVEPFADGYDGDTLTTVGLNFRF